jgi:hypothetical protein
LAFDAVKPHHSRLFLEQIIFPWYPRQANDSMPFPYCGQFPFLGRVQTLI